MTKYVDSYVLPIPKKNLAAYFRMARKAAKVWREHGALNYHECVGEDLDVKFGLPFPRGIRSKKGEVIVFAWVEYKSRAHRDRVNAKVMSDPRLAAMCDPKNLPFDGARMIWGGFKVVV
jgi:uncharacterized protein YbaA (DUF1428 family)